MIFVAAIVVVAFGLALIGFTGVAFANPASARRFLSAFASSARTHYLEQILRLVIGAALIVLSPTMWQGKIFWLFGWAIVVSSTVLLCMPWQWHRRLGARLLPALVRLVRVYAVGAFVLGMLLLYGVFRGGGSMAGREAESRPLVDAFLSSPDTFPESPVPRPISALLHSRPRRTVG